MGKSQETFSKKEKEKKRLQKRKEKEEKKQQRKENTKKGKTLEEMMAYVDEYGRITSTPPDPKKKRQVNAEEIEISGVAKRIDADPIHTGKVSYFNQEKGYGFIRDDLTKESVFVHMNALIEKVKEHDSVTFEIEMAHRGPNAVRVKKIVPEKPGANKPAAVKPVDDKTAVEKPVEDETAADNTTAEKTE